MRGAYYNEFDPYAAAWLRNLISAGLIAPGDVDDRSIIDVQPSDLEGYTQCHFFAGIGGWSYAARLAGWPDERPLWTGSCPCQPFSSAARGRRNGTNDARDLWPTWWGLITAIRPRVVFGEQVAHGDGWIDRACDDLEGIDYEVGAAVIPAVSVGKDHARPRLYFVGHSNRDGEPVVQIDGQMARLQRDRGNAGSLVPQDGIPGRMALFSGFGNAIVPQVAAEVIGAFMDVESRS